MATPEDKARDLDETRRLLYMAIVAPTTKKYNLAGTLINALRHHQGVDDPGLESKIIAQLNAGPGEASQEQLMREHIARITTELEAGDE